MSDMTLREICEAASVTRRAVQVYEEMGLVTPTGKTSRGYLLYDEIAQERIKIIRRYQGLGFSLKEVQEIIDASSEVKRKALLDRIEKLKDEGRNIEKQIKVATELLEAL